MSALFASEKERLVWQLAIQDEADEAAHGDASESDPLVNLLYLRIADRLSTVLLQDTAHDLSDNDPPDEQSVYAAATRREAFETASQLKHRYVELKHPRVNASAAAFLPERDIVFFSHELDLEYLKEMSKFYGPQLDAVQNVMFEASEWADLENCLKAMEFFNRVCMIYVWLESDRFANNIDRVTEKNYLAMVRQFKTRDEVALEGRNVTVEYIDYKGNVHGGLRTDVKRRPRPASQLRQRPSSARESQTFKISKGSKRGKRNKRSKTDKAFLERF